MTNLLLYTLVWFAWRANTEPELAGYRLYSGPQSGVYVHSSFIPKPNTNGCVSVVRGTTNYFTLTSVMSNGLESIPAIELSHWTLRPQIYVTIEGSANGEQWAPAVAFAWDVPMTNVVTPQLYRGRLEFR